LAVFNFFVQHRMNISEPPIPRHAALGGRCSICPKPIYWA
jgi:hypothetical protein